MGSTSTDSYKVGDRVFAKIRGYPHWPAQVTERRPGVTEEYCVAFYGSHEIAHVKPNVMCLYDDDSIKKYAEGYSAKKKSSRNSVLAFQKAMEECFANVNFIPVEVDDEVEEEEEEHEEWQDDSPSEDPLAAVTKSVPQVEEMTRIPRRGRPPKALALKNLNIADNSLNEINSSRNGEQSSHIFEADTQLVTPDSDDVEIPIIVTNVESLSGKIQPVENPNSPASVEELLVVDESNNRSSGQGSVVSRSGRRIKPKIFADGEVESPMAEYLKSTVGSGTPQLQKKRKASFDDPAETPKKIALETMPIRQPRKSISISIDSEDGNVSESSSDVPEIIKIQRGGKRQSLATTGESSSISWKEEAMRPLEDKLIKSCKRLETIQMQTKCISQSIVTTPVRDKLASVSVAHVGISPAPLSQPVISKSMGAIAKIVAGETNKKMKAGSSVTKKSVGVGTSVLELKGAHRPEKPDQSKSNAEEFNDKESVKVVNEKHSQVETNKRASENVSDSFVSQMNGDNDKATSLLEEADEKSNLPLSLHHGFDTPKRVTFGGTMTKDLDESDEKDSSTPLSINKRKSAATPSSIMKKPRITSPEKKKEDASAGRSHLQRRVEVPLRYKDSVTSPKDVIKSGVVTKKSDSVVTSESPVNSSDENLKINGVNGIESDANEDRPKTNGLEGMSDEEEDEDADLTEADFPDDHTKQRFNIQIKAKAVMETVVLLINSAMETDQNLDLALEMLVKLGEEGFVDKLIIKSYPDIVHVVRKMKHFVGNAKALKLTKAQKAEFPKKTEKIREQATKTLEGFKELMTANTKPLAVLIMEEVRRKNSETAS